MTNNGGKSDEAAAPAAAATELTSASGKSDAMELGRAAVKIKTRPSHVIARLSSQVVALEAALAVAASANANARIRYGLVNTTAHCLELLPFLRRLPAGQSWPPDLFAELDAAAEELRAAVHPMGLSDVISVGCLPSRLLERSRAIFIAGPTEAGHRNSLATCVDRNARVLGCAAATGVTHHADLEIAQSNFEFVAHAFGSAMLLEPWFFGLLSRRFDTGEQVPDAPPQLWESLVDAGNLSPEQLLFFSAADEWWTARTAEMTARRQALSALAAADPANVELQDELVAELEQTQRDHIACFIAVEAVMHTCVLTARQCAAMLATVWPRSPLLTAFLRAAARRSSALHTHP